LFSLFYNQFGESQFYLGITILSLSLS